MVQNTKKRISGKRQEKSRRTRGGRVDVENDLTSAGKGRSLRRAPAAIVIDICKEIILSINQVVFKSVTMPSGETVEIKYWTDQSTVYVAGFDANGKQVTAATYQAVVDDIANDFVADFRKSLIEGLADNAENDLKTNPQLHYRP
ncbi:hypothetical protein OR573_14305 [Halomonas sp. CH40]